MKFVSRILTICSLLVAIVALSGCAETACADCGTLFKDSCVEGYNSCVEAGNSAGDCTEVSEALCSIL
jgi:hypothetical protein